MSIKGINFAASFVDTHYLVTCRRPAAATGCGIGRNRFTHIAMQRSLVHTVRGYRSTLFTAQFVTYRLLSDSMSTAAGRPPNLSNQCIAELLKERFPFKYINEKAVKSLPSYDDRNFYFKGILDLEHHQKGDLSCSDSTTPACSQEVEYVLKVNNPLFASFEVLKGINVILRHLCTKGFPCIQPLYNREGDDAFLMSGEDLLKHAVTSEESAAVPEATRKTTFIVRVVSFIPGELFDEIEKRYLTPKLLYEVGNVFGRITQEMQEIRVPEIEARHLGDWDLMNFLDLRQYVDDLDDPKQRQIAERVIDDFEEHVAPKIPSFKKGLMYGDANGLNIVVRKGKASDEYELAGIIDFGDCNISCYIFDLGILLGYIMLENIEPLGGKSPVEFVVPLLRGYVDAFPFSQEEIGSLYYLAMARCCQSTVLGIHCFKKEPWNTYLLTTPRKCWRILELLLDTPKEEVDRIWSEALNRN